MNSRNPDSSPKFPGEEFAIDKDMGLDRTNFAVELHEQGMLVDFEDWDGMSDYAVLGLVCHFYPGSDEKIINIWKRYCREG